MPIGHRATSHRFLASFVAALLLAGAGCGARAPLAAFESSDVRVLSDLTYVHRGDGDLHADVYLPRGSGPFPAVLVVHGGSWRRGDKSRMAGAAERLAERGYVAVSIDYRLAPVHKFPAPLYDCQEAVRWMRANASYLHLDPARIAGFGYSAGAHLVALLATTGSVEALDEAPSARDDDIRLQAAVLGAAPIDLRRFPPNWILPRFLGASPDERPDLYALASPITFVSADDPPMFLYHGADDWMVAPSQSQLMRDALKRAGVPAEYYEAPGGHFTTFLFDDGQVSRAIDFLDRWLKG